MKKINLQAKRNPIFCAKNPSKIFLRRFILIIKILNHGKKIQDLLVQQGFHKALGGKRNKLAMMIDEEWEDLDARALNTIRLCLTDDVLFNIIGEGTKT